MAPPLVEFVFDSSALVKYYNPEQGTKALRFWLNDLRKQQTHQVRFFVPNICIPEILHVFYVLRHIKRKVTDELLKCLLATFLADLEQGKLTVCNLTRQDVLATEPLYEVAHEEYRRRRHQHEGLLSPIDIMILAMATNFRQRHPHLFLVKADTQMIKVANRI